MKINSLGARPTVSGSKGSDTRVSSSTNTVEASAKVNISSSSTLSDIQSSDGVVNMEKVKAVAQAIREGKFEINASAIANRLLDDTHNYLQTSQAAH